MNCIRFLIFNLALGVSACNGVPEPQIDEIQDANLIAVEKPEVPTELKAIAGDAKITLNWKPSNRALSYKVLSGNKAGGPYTKIASAPSTTHTDIDLINSTTYFYVVQGINETGVSPNSLEASATPLISDAHVLPPLAPTGLVAVAFNATRINLSWTENSINENGYKVERKSGLGGTYVIVTTLGEGASTFSDNGLITSTQYFYRVYTYNEAGNSVNSNEANATTQVPAVSGAMVSLPGGTFDMGDVITGPSVTLVHSVTLSAFDIDVKEVSNGQYQTCVTAGTCTAPSNENSYSHSPYFGSTTYDTFPVIYVDWAQASTYCAWASKRLPTEAEWEYAARGGLAGYRYPWGNTIDCSMANYYTTNGNYPYDVDPYFGSKYCVGDTAQAGSYAANGYGLYDMAGNVWEWVNDWYSSTYYSMSPATNPTGPSTGTYRVQRGGSFDDGASDSRLSYRKSNSPPTHNLPYVGFRCAR